MNQIYKYNYNAVNKLPFLTEDFKGKIKKIGIYDIFLNNNSSTPFLRFLLEKNMQGEFDFLNINSEPFTTVTIVNFLKTFFEKYNVNINSDILRTARVFSKDKDNDDNDFYLFIDVSYIVLETRNSLITKSMVLIHEIINTKQIYNTKIAESVTDFFIKHYEFAFIQNHLNHDYEIPIIGYVCKPLHKVEYTFVFGLSTLDSDSDFNFLYPNFCCFTDYSYFLFKETQKDIKEEKKGILRFALFTGKLLLIENENEILEVKEKHYDYDCIQMNNENNHSIYLIKNIFQSIPLSFYLLNQ
jgi:hypothetical protein